MMVMSSDGCVVAGQQPQPSSQSNSFGNNTMPFYHHHHHHQPPPAPHHHQHHTVNHYANVAPANWELYAAAWIRNTTPGNTADTGGCAPSINHHHLQSENPFTSTTSSYHPTSTPMHHCLYAPTTKSEEESSSPSPSSCAFTTPPPTSMHIYEPDYGSSRFVSSQPPAPPLPTVPMDPDDHQQRRNSNWMLLPSQHNRISNFRTGPGTNNIRVRTNEKYRMVYSDYQRLELEKEFCFMNFINAERKSALSTQLDLTERQIKIWFQNRRAKKRRQDNRSN